MISSHTADRPIHLRSTYIAGKGAIDALSGSTRSRPAIIRTDRLDTLGAATRNRRHAKIPLGIEANGTDSGQAVAFLASDQAAYLVGAGLTIDCGASTQLFPADVEA